jgi:hypothetical protein
MLNIVITLTVGFAGLMVLLSALRQFRRDGFAPPTRSLDPRIYRLLERARHRLFRGSRAVRFTVFAPDVNDPDVIRPTLRLGWGRAARHSTVALHRGEGLAGRAWTEEGSILLARFDDLAEPAARISAHVQVLGLPDAIARSLSDAQLRSQALIAARIEDSVGQLRGVLTIDSIDGIGIPEVPDDDLAPPDVAAFWTEVARLATELAAAMEEPSNEVHSGLIGREFAGLSLRRYEFRPSPRQSTPPPLAA